MPCWKKKSTLYSISTWPIFLNFGKCKICARTRCSNSKSQQLFLNFSKYDWYLGPHLRRRGLCIVGTLGLDLKNQWAGFALEKRLPSISNRLRSLNPILSSAVSVHLLYPGSTGRSGLCDWQQLTSHKHAYTTWTLQFCFLISFKGFFLVVFFVFLAHYSFVVYPQWKLFTYYCLTSIWSFVSDFICIKMFWAGRDRPCLQSQRRNPVFQKALPHQTCCMLSSGLIEHRGSLLWGSLSR